MRTLFLAAALVAGLAACSSKPEQNAQGGTPCVALGLGDPGVCDVALVQLIARPELFDGKRVRVIGFVNFEFEGNGLYISKEDWSHSIYRNGLWIDAPANAQIDSGGAKGVPNRQYVLVEGTFNAKLNGHMGMWSGTLEKVTRLQAWH